MCVPHVQQEYFFSIDLLLICDDAVAGAVIVSLTPSNKNEGGLGNSHHPSKDQLCLYFLFLANSPAVDSNNAWKRRARFVKENPRVKTAPERFLLN